MSIRRVQQHINQGFTLVETLVAITILLLVIVGPMTAAQRGIQQSYFSNEQIIATFLAQEAVEGMRVFRDGSALDLLDSSAPAGLESTDWLYLGGTNSIDSRCVGSQTCSFDKTATLPYQAFEQCVDEECEVVIDVNTGEYIQGGTGSGTGFNRTVTIFNDGNDNIRVVSKVTWDSSVFGGEREVVVQSWIYDQYQRYE